MRSSSGDEKVELLAARLLGFVTTILEVIDDIITVVDGEIVEDDETKR